MYRIFIVEDDFAIAESLRRHIASWGFEARACQDFRRVTDELFSLDPHLVLLDISLPFEDGYHWCREIRKQSKVPVVFISSAGDNLNIVTAMTLGADDFITKPFDLTVLHAKLLALLRRAYDFADAPKTLDCRGLSLSREDTTLAYGSTRLTLTRNEYRILRTLMERQGRVVSREALMEQLWNTDSFVDENTLSVNVNRLRRKLAALGLPDLIATRKGLGYVIEREGL